MKLGFLFNFYIIDILFTYIYHFTGNVNWRHTIWQTLRRMYEGSSLSRLLPSNFVISFIGDTMVSSIRHLHVGRSDVCLIGSKTDELWILTLGVDVEFNKLLKKLCHLMAF